MDTKKLKTEKARRNSRVTREQKQYLINFMTRNPVFASKSLSNTFTRRDYDVMLKMMTNHLNQIGPRKTEDKWLRTWLDMKIKARSAGIVLSSNYKNTGGDSSDIPLLSQNEEKIIQMSGDEEVACDNKCTECGTPFRKYISFNDRKTNKKRIEEKNYFYPLHQRDDTIDKSSDVEDDPETVVIMDDNEDYCDEVQVLLNTDKSQNLSQRSPLLCETNTKKIKFGKKRKEPNKLTPEVNELLQSGGSDTSSQPFPAINMEAKMMKMELEENVKYNTVTDVGPTSVQKPSIFNNKIKKSKMILEAANCDIDRRLEEESKRQTVAMERIAAHLGTLVECQKSIIDVLNKMAAAINSNK